MQIILVTSLQLYKITYFCLISVSIIRFPFSVIDLFVTILFEKISFLTNFNSNF